MELTPGYREMIRLPSAICTFIKIWILSELAKRTWKWLNLSWVFFQPEINPKSVFLIWHFWPSGYMSKLSYRSLKPELNQDLRRARFVFQKGGRDPPWKINVLSVRHTIYYIGVLLLWTNDDSVLKNRFLDLFSQICYLGAFSVWGIRSSGWKILLK